MRLFRFLSDGTNERLGVELPDGKLVQVAAPGITDYDGRFFADDGIARLRSWIQGGAADTLPDLRTKRPQLELLPPIARPGNMICIGLNYRQHAEESGMKLPPEPVIFLKHTGSFAPPNADLIIPRGSEKTDYEVELGVVIGRAAHNIQLADALSYVAGYTVIHDVSERAWQLEKAGGQWDKGKAFPTFAPIGPFLVPAQDIADPQKLRLWLRVNGEMRQDSSTADMFFTVQHLVWYCSTVFGLLPGDVISTGTPQGVGHGFKPPRYLTAGDVVELGIDGLGEQRQSVKAAA